MSKLYLDAYGRDINFLKSSITFGKNINQNMRRLLREYMAIEQEGGAGKYLGLPKCFSGSKSQFLAFITDNLKGRLSGWYAKTLLLWGKKVLLKSVAIALQVYAISCFQLSKFQCQQIASAMQGIGGIHMKIKTKCIGFLGRNFASRKMRVA